MSGKEVLKAPKLMQKYLKMAQNISFYIFTVVEVQCTAVPVRHLHSLANKWRRASAALAAEMTVNL